jgi:hypothetical protein
VKLDAEDLLRNENNFELKIYSIKPTLDTTVIKSIHADNEMIVQLKDWISENSWYWLESDVNYDAYEAILVGQNFNFKIYDDFVVIGYKDRKGSYRQFFKYESINKFCYIMIKKKITKTRCEMIEEQMMLDAIPR